MQIYFQALSAVFLSANGIGLIFCLSALLIQAHHYFSQIRGGYEPLDSPLDYTHPPGEYFVEIGGVKKTVHRSLLWLGVALIFGNAIINHWSAAILRLGDSIIRAFL